MTNEEAIEELRDASDLEVIYGDTKNHYAEVMKRVEALEMAIKALEQTRPKGKWIATENEDMDIVGYYCSCCDLPMETEEKTNYCPNCGADMRGDSE